MQVSAISLNRRVGIFSRQVDRTAPSSVSSTASRSMPQPFLSCVKRPYFLGQQLPKGLDASVASDVHDPDDRWGLSDVRKGSLEILGILNPNFLRQLGQKPRVHPNGFIQMDITPKKRLHIWGHPAIPRQKVSMPIHDHVYGFRSQVLAGRIVNINYEMDPEGCEFDIWSPTRHRKQGGGAIEPTGMSCGIRPVSTEVILAKDDPEKGGVSRHYYDMPPWVLHETFVPEPTITLIDKDGPTLDQNPEGPLPKMLAPAGKIPDLFSRYAINEADLWQIIDEVMSQAADRCT